jgi:hypothetical protein
MLPDGRILLAGGSSGAAAYPAAAEFYTPASGTCSPGPELEDERQQHTATLLPAGEVLLAGGGTTPNTFFSSSELYDSPNLTTPNATLITATSARLGGTVANIGSAAVTGRGIVFSRADLNDDPKLGGANVTDVTATGTTGSFTVDVSDLTPATAYRFRAYATNGVGTGYSAVGSFTTSHTLETWRQKWYGISTDTGDAADDADPHGTGVANLLVFAFLGPDQDPALVQPSQLPQAAWITGGFGYSFSAPAGVSGVIYGAEQSATLETGSWTTVPDADGTGAYRFVIPEPVSGDQRQFLRLKVTRE